ncbi:MAG: bifunctional alpha,alpha-trehalose-phosphate synthase (UDP-forming)/trehalose-phosphatase [Deltaproteobacteria bacterium]|nr:MAG: bifunctional alpha,alpha-trehalose-phosphate synthase (UDP-forming)/trehalose-phosphatase [Deltaproteobacteria bacterium]
MRRLLMVSNRLPFSIEKRKDSLQFRPSVGGLATGLESFYKSYQSLWVGWPGIALDKIKEESEAIKTKLNSEFNCHPVFLTQSDIENYYYGFCNRTIWPLFHYFNQYVIYDERLWRSYKRVNEFYCDVVMEVVRDDDLIWIHDYHLTLLPRLIRERRPDATIGFFLHIPFPSYEIFRLLPWRKEILEGLLGVDVIGFHTYDYVQHFVNNVHRILGYEYKMGRIVAGNCVVMPDAFPMGIDYQRFSEAAQEPEVRKEMIRFQKKLGECKVVLSIDRLDYSKGIPQRLEAFDTFLERNPEYREKVVIILVAVPSRTQVEHYRMLKKQVDELVGRINGKYGTIGWVPILYLYHAVSFPSLAALYRISDVAFLTPLRDGMNLIAKEYIASKTEGRGVLVLSEMAGASRELGEAIIVNPQDTEELVEALGRALKMSEQEQEERNRAMQERLQRYDIARWVEEFIDRLLYAKKLQRETNVKILTSKTNSRLVGEYRKSKKRLLLLDYDGTLIPFFGKPEEARPDDELLRLLEKLTEDPKNQVVLISGRDKDTMERWFGKLKLNLLAEHGIWIKEKGKEKKWEMIEPLTDEWKKDIHPVLELYMDRTPGSFIEEKGFSLVWHYRKADPDLGTKRARELIEVLENLTVNLNLRVSGGNKVVEIRSTRTDKGRAAMRWTSQKKWDFLLAAGDDLTDEDLFAVIPETGYSIKVGISPSKARLNLYLPNDLRSLLKELIGGG